MMLWRSPAIVLAVCTTFGNAHSQRAICEAMRSSARPKRFFRCQHIGTLEPVEPCSSHMGCWYYMCGTEAEAAVVGAS